MKTLEIMGLHREFQFTTRRSDVRAAGRTPILMAEDGSEAPAIAEEECPRLIFPDCLLPVVDGAEVLRRPKAPEATVTFR
jgi:CheY-like chemotaxis protein